MRHPSSRLWRPRVISSGRITCPMPCSIPSRLTMRTPALLGSNSATSRCLRCLGVGTCHCYFPGRDGNGEEWETHFCMSPSMAGFNLATPPLECRPFPGAVSLKRIDSEGDCAHTYDKMDLRFSPSSGVFNGPLCERDCLFHIQPMQIDLSWLAILQHPQTK